jgi:hypothetical protein
MEIEHLIIANGSSIDQERNALSVFDMIEDFQIQTNVEKIHVPIQVILVLKREPAETGESKQKFRFEIYGPDGARTFHQEFPVSLAPAQRRFRMRAGLPLVISRSGSYRFALLRIDKPEVSRETDIIVQVRQAPQPGNVQ